MEIFTNYQDALVKAGGIIHIIYFVRFATWKGNTSFFSNCYIISHLP